jgi:tripartite ATP-independent transporter DctM subunit
MFIVMGNVAFYAGFTRDAYSAAYKWVGNYPGGLGVATLLGAVAFGACSGSSIAATAALGKSALPEMLRFGYNHRLAAGCVAMGGTLDALIPPSILLVIYGVVTEESIGKLLMAGLVPGLLSMAVFALLVVVWALFRPADAPRGERFPLRDKLIGLKDVSGILILFVCVAGGLLTGVFTPTEAGAVGAFLIFVMALAMGRLFNRTVLREIVTDSLRVTSSIFLIVLGAYIFIQFLALTRLPVVFATWVIGLPVHPMVILMGVILLYLVMGCFLDALGLILLTVPFIGPALFGLGFDAIWFGVLVVKLVEIGLITPPVGIQAYVLKGVAPSELTLQDIFLGFVPFFLVDLFVVIGLIVAFPQISLFLPSLMK